ncbi:hypothetical protein BN863_28450 [Formosa agariphila KMM 3901]|uniref:Uncharacterized protein n=1 Tax=Formosa agariphila (strain DSM 15362 / KCTC 12365 / LMG 23005 / KMM 3901 / M-2Alg 35-1) TaxID=1347342 RepID=T2KNW2_FORAG|nr:leucine-rich repeat protein [Formosa agariphila]CDF80557.1 hypothetical protein BN863_28450 [Formosa agariphila KMM 3901]
MSLIQQKYINGISNPYYEPNTFIGGVSTDVPDKLVLASKLGINASNIPYFKIIGSDVEAYIDIDYEITGTQSFRDNLNLTYFKCLEGRLKKGISSNIFGGCANLQYFEAVGLTYIGYGFLQSTPNLIEIKMPALTDPSSETNAFVGVNPDCDIYVPIEAMTANNGYPLGVLYSTGNWEVNYIGYVDNPLDFNTELGGVQNILTSRALVGEKIGVKAARIVNLSIDSDRIKFKVLAPSYSIASYAFQNDQNLTFYNDSDLVVGFGSNAFYNCGVSQLTFNGVINFNSGGTFRNMSNLTSLVMNNCVTWRGGQSIRNTPLLVNWEMPSLEAILSGNLTFYDFNTNLTAKKLKQAGPTVGDDTMFTNASGNRTIKVHEFLATSNGGLADEDLQYLKDSRGYTVEFYDDNGDYVSTL